MIEVSVVIATFNRNDSLRQLVHDLQNQDIDSHRYEVVVVDDGSATPTSIESGPGPQVQCLRQVNAGPAAARDRGITASVGEIIVIVDDDMRVGSGFVGAHLDEHRRGADVALGAILARADGEDRPLFDRFHHHSLDRWVAALADGTAEVRGGQVCTGNVSFRRADYRLVGGFDQTMRRCEDRDLGIRFEAQGRRLVFRLWVA